ncbi:MBL fold metallo-hydrolase [Amaricoccus solimangrovi]|uniref:MBL fold metallo-hydrolase n=1 Tax=Amaricoccus solimangrovi TaxID=2589815 RepID=A0A501X079_9RHOB|nr:MBL fold metallo-hydrolase [Amaricoccus solimangrovi]TPE52921.1 MBL fold metallo-hydrolase [Amaricoccus solimangrovi]
MARLRVTILGCGSSGGVPRLGELWGACDPKEPRNRRRRCSILVERMDGEAATRVLIDTSPDLRAQLLDAGVGLLDAVAYTHPHADHVHGIDDLRMIVFNRQSRLPVWADQPTSESLLTRFGYAFVQPPGSLYPPILDLRRIEGAFTVDGAGGPIEFRPFTVRHGRIDALGFRIGHFAYLPDVSEIPEETWPALAGLDMLVIDALRYTPHPTHAHLERTLQWIERARPRAAVLTNMHIDLDYATLAAEVPPGVTPAHDGMVLDLAP